MNKTNEHQNQTSEDNVLSLQQMMFDQMKRLSDPNADLEKEIKRGQALTAAGTVVINAAKVQIDAVRVRTLAENKKKSDKKEIGNG